MQLWYAPTSPFARKVRITAHELGLETCIELIEVNPWRSEALRTLNPLSKVPTLVRDDGFVLFESAVICDYLDSLSAERRLHPADGDDRWHTLRIQGLADGAMTAAGRLYADAQKSEAERFAFMMARFQTAIDAALDTLEDQGKLRPEPSIGEIAVAALLGYLDFRWPERDWRSERPGTARWYDAFAQRPSMVSTGHHLPA